MAKKQSLCKLFSNKFVLRNTSLFIAGTLASSLIVSPILLTSCAKSDWTVSQDPNNPSNLLLNSAKVPALSTGNIFSQYQNILNSNESTIKSFEESFNQLTNNLYSSYSLEFTKSKLNLSNYTITIPVVKNSTYTTTNIPQLSTITLSFPSLNQSSFSKILSENSIVLDRSSNFPQYTLEQLLDLSPSNVSLTNAILTRAQLPISTTQLLFNDLDKIEGFIKTDDYAQNKLTLFFFDRANTTNPLGQIIISQDKYDASCNPTTTITSVFGADVANDLPSILSNSSSIPLFKDWSDSFFTTIIDRPNTLPTYNNLSLLLSYKDFLASPQATELLSKYTSSSNNTLPRLFQDDYNFFVKTFFNDIASSWNNSSIYFNSLFACHNVSFDSSSKTFSGSIGLQVLNQTSNQQKVTLPINQKSVTIEPNQSLTIIINLEKSKVSPTLLTFSRNANSATLAPLFSNLKMEYTLAPIVGESDSIAPFHFSFSNPMNLWTNSLGLKTLIKNVSPDVDFAQSSTLISNSKKQLTESDLKYIKLSQLSDSFNTTKNVVSAIETLMLKIADNPTIYNFLQSIQHPIYQLLFSLTGNENISQIISGLFSTDKTSLYLSRNMPFIISLVNSLSSLFNDAQLVSITNLLTDIATNHSTPEKMHEWVASIEGLAPTLEKLLGDGVGWLMPLIVHIMQSISTDRPIIEFLFNNIEFIFNFIENEIKNNGTTHIDATSAQLIQTVITYLHAIANYSQEVNKVSNLPTDSIEKYTTLYKNIHALDIFAYELSQFASDSTLFNLISSIVSILLPNESTTSIISTIKTILKNNVIVDSIITDNSNATFKNEVKTTTNLLGTKYTFEKYNVESGSFTTTLIDQLAKTIRSIFTVTVSGKTLTISQMLQSNVNMEWTNTFSYKNELVNQKLTVKYNFINEVKWDLMPFSILLDNIHVGISKTQFDSICNSLDTIPIVGGLISDINSINKVLNSVVGVALKEYSYKMNNIDQQMVTIDLARLFPTDITIKPENNFILEYSAINSPVYPYINAQGDIYWSYHAQENIFFNVSTVLTNANSDKPLDPVNSYNPKTNPNALSLLTNQKYYGDLWNRFYKFIFQTQKINDMNFNIGSSDLQISLNNVAIRALITGFLGDTKPAIINPEPSISNSSTIQTSKPIGNPIINYNPNIYNPGYIVTYNKTKELDLSSFISQYVEWKNSTDNPQQQSLTLKTDGDKALRDLVAQTLQIGSKVNYTVSLAASKLNVIGVDLSNGVKVTSTQDTYTIYVYFDSPVLYTINDTTVSPSTSSTTQVQYLTLTYTTKS